MSVNSWRQEGNIYIWSYEGNPKNYPGWHLHCDRDGAQSIIELASLLKDANSGEKRTARLSVPTKQQLSVPGCPQKPLVYSKLVLKKAETWSITSEAGKLVMNLPESMNESLERGVSSILEGKGDYYIGTEGSELWFWW